MRRKGTSERLDRERAIETLCGGWDIVDGMRSPILKDFSEKERQDIVTEANARYYERREREREPILKSRLLEWPVSQWGSIFCERQDLLDTLNAEQRARWDAWRAKSQSATPEKSTLRLVTTKPATRAARS